MYYRKVQVKLNRINHLTLQGYISNSLCSDGENAFLSLLLYYFYATVDG